MAADGLQRMLDYLHFLRSKNIHYFIEHHGDDCLTVALTLVGVRVEVMFSVEDMTFSIFKGNEDIITDIKILDDLIKERRG